MLRFSMGYTAQPLSRRLVRPVHEVLMFAAGSGVIARASGSTPKLELVVVAPSPHAGSYQIDVAPLARGPVCVIPPSISNPDGTGTGAGLIVTPGLWVCDAGLGQHSTTGQWLADGVQLADQNGASLAIGPDHEGHNISYAETVRQGAFETLRLSQVIAIPQTGGGTAPEEPIDVTLSPAASFQATADAETGLLTLTIAAPAVHAGQYTVDPADLAAGPVSLARPVLTIAADGARFDISRSGLWACDADAGAVTQSYSWQADGEVIPGATGTGYLAGTGDDGKTIAAIERIVQGSSQRTALSNGIVKPAAGADGMQTLSNNTVIFTQTGNTVSVIEPAAYAGDYVVPTGTQPVAAVPPLLAGSTREGETMTITRALWWIEPGAGATTISWQIYSNGQPIPGAPQSDSGAMYWDYVLPAGLRGTALTVQERIIQNGVTQTITSAPVTISDIPARKNLDSFTGYGPNTLSGYVGETGLSWTRNPNGTGYGVAVGGGRCYSSVGVNRSPAFYRDSPLSGDQYAGGKLTYGTYTSSYPNTGAFPAVRLSSEPVSGSDGTGYRIGFEHNTQLWMIVKTVGSARTNLGSVPNVDFGFTEAGDTVDVMLEAEGTTLRLYINEVVVLTVNDSTLKTGRIGVMGFGSGSNAIQLADFYGGEL